MVTKYSSAHSFVSVSLQKRKSEERAAEKMSLLPKLPKTAENPWGRGKHQALLQLMNVRPLRRGDDFDIMLWDTASQVYYVRLDHAKRIKFPYNLERVKIKVVTGQVEMDKIVPVFQCRLMDEDGDLNFFFAVGVQEIELPKNEG